LVELVWFLALHTSLKYLWKERLADKVMDKIHYYATKLLERQPEWMKSAGAAAKVRI
jgi:hypothetical protein